MGCNCYCNLVQWCKNSGKSAVLGFGYLWEGFVSILSFFLYESHCVFIEKKNLDGQRFASPTILEETLAFEGYKKGNQYSKMHQFLGDKSHSVLFS